MFSTLVIRANEVDDAPSAALSDDTLLALSTQPLDAQQQSIESSVNTKWNRATHLKAATSDSANSQGSTSSLISQGLKSKPNRSSRSNIMAAALGISKASRSSHDTGDTLNNESFEKVLNGRWERALDIAAQHRSSTDLYTGGKNGTNNVPGMNTEISRSSSSAPLRRDSSRRVASVVLSGVSSSAASKQSEDKVSKKANDRWERASHLMHSQSYGGAFDPPPPGAAWQQERLMVTTFGRKCLIWHWASMVAAAAVADSLWGAFAM
ncbi:hypothetical protein BASA62_009320 [Batrachochytrium salamandrivorans]|nr:hypothetical protein BASA62_009320 [Batrachochytrium salamandrivorans]